jgi:hypothetical protein
MTDKKEKEIKESLYLDDNPRPKRSLALVTKKTWGSLENKSKTSLQTILESGAEDYSSIELTEKEEENLVKILKKMATGAAAFSPMRCAGSECPFAIECPLVQMKPAGHPQHGKAPVTKPCLLEETMLKEAVMNYVTEYEVDPNNFTELGICTELAEIEVLQWRLTMALRRPENAGLVIDQVIGVDPRTNEQITQLQVSPIFEQKQKLANRKSRLVKLMVGDRQEKYKKEAALKERTGDDPSSQMASVKRKLDELQQSVKMKQRETDGEVIEAEIVSPEDLINEALDEKKKGE